MTISALPPVPQRTDLPADFVVKADNFVAHLPVLAEQINETAAGMNAIAAGGAYAIPLVFDGSSTTSAAPGAGKIRFNNLTQSNATSMYVDLVDASGVTITSQLDAFDNSTSVIKGTLRFVNTSDKSKWAIFNITDVNTPSGYRTLLVSSVDSSSSNPFSDGDSLVMYFQRTGDKGDTTSNTAFTPQLISAVNINCSLGNYHYKTVAGATTFTFSNVPTGGFSMTVDVQLDSGSIAWPASVKIARDQWPTLAAGKTHLFFLSTKDGGARWRLTVADNFVN